MFTALLSFLGGSAFRMIFGAVSEYFDKRQEHQQELDRMKVESDLAQQRHTQDCERLRLQSELGVKQVEVQADADVSRMEAQAFVEAMKQSYTPTGNKYIDAWNGGVRPFCATIAVFLWVFALAHQHFTMTDWDKELVGVILGYFFASRVLVKDRK